VKARHVFISRSHGQEAKVIDQRVGQTGRWSFFLKWKGFTDADNHWEPEENLGLSQSSSERSWTRRRGWWRSPSPTKRKPSTESSERRGEQSQEEEGGGKMISAASKPRGFARNLEPERIIGATDSSGELMFLMKWKDSDEADLVVISFYEERLTWHSCPEDEQQ
uniref:Chromo domain-containing protein n=1 Tax=Denticeps clupeoides TaxID=299321 RepID=A0AAY4BGQ9_9TELE